MTTNKHGIRYDEEFKKAYAKRNAPYGLMFHSNRRSQYTAFTFRQLLDSLNVVQTFSKKEYSFDNACYECFFKYFKKKKLAERPTTLCRNYSFLSLNILKNTIIPEDHTVLWKC